MRVEQRRGLPGRRDLLDPVSEFPLPFAELERGISGFPGPPWRQDRQVVIFTDHQVPRETTVELPAGFDQGPLYIF